MTSQFLRFAIARGLVCASALASCVVQAGITVNDHAEQVGFVEAVPVWPEGRTDEPNAFVGFRADFVVRKGERPVLRVAGLSLYRAWVNGKFAGYGPARAGHGYFRVDEWPLEKLVREGSAVAAGLDAFSWWHGLQIPNSSHG